MRKPPLRLIATTLLAAGLLFGASQAKAAADTAPSVTLDHKKTPGHAAKKDNLTKICAGNYVAKAKLVKNKTAKKVFKTYKVSNALRDAYEIDHLVPVEIGGDNDKKNLWPQLKTDAAAKNAVEANARALVCAKHISLKDAQKQFKTDWHGAQSRFETIDTSVIPRSAPEITTTSTTSITTTTTTAPPPTTAVTVTTLRPATTTASKSSPNYYTNSSGDQIESPDSSTSGATAICKDGTYSHSASRQGTCSRHGGVSAWL